MIWKTSTSSCQKEYYWTNPRAFLQLWFCKYPGEQGLNVQETLDVSSGTVVTSSHWITMLHLANIISINWKTFFLLPLFLNFFYLTLSAKLAMTTSSDPSLNIFYDLPKGYPHLRVVKVFWHPKSTITCLFLGGLGEFPLSTQLTNKNSYQYCDTVPLFVAHAAIPNLQLEDFSYFLNL